MNLNKVYLIGRLASDPEFRTTPGGQEVATLRMVTNRVWNDRASGQRNESSEFHTVVVWGRLAQIANQYLNKGSLTMIEGRLQTRSWEGQDGIKRYRTEIVAEGLQLGPKPFRPGSASEFKGRTPEIKNKKDLPSEASAKEGEIPVINEDEPPAEAPLSGTPAEPEIEEEEVQLKDVPF
ncbi:MAG: single-stranded DNA-binding protein [Parcubacteria group bacterium]|nr:single-stranded DNA-binding protein [Parcubacteria group bacterium]